MITGTTDLWSVDGLWRMKIFRFVLLNWQGGPDGHCPVCCDGCELLPHLRLPCPAATGGPNPAPNGPAAAVC